MKVQIRDGQLIPFRSIRFYLLHALHVEHDITITLEPLPAFLKEMVLDGGLVPHLEKRFANAAAEKDII